MEDLDLDHVTSALSDSAPVVVEKPICDNEVRTDVDVDHQHEQQRSNNPFSVEDSPNVGVIRNDDDDVNNDDDDHRSKHDSSPELLRHQDSSTSEENDLTESGKEDLIARQATAESQCEEDSRGQQHRQHEGTESSQEEPALSSLRNRSGDDDEDDDEDDDDDSDLGKKPVGVKENREPVVNLTMNSSYEQVPGMEEAGQSNQKTSFGSRAELQQRERQQRQSGEEEDVDADLPESERHVVMDPRYRTASQQTMVQSSSSSSSRAAANFRSGFDGLTTSLGESLPRISSESRGFGSNPTMMDASDSSSPHSFQRSQRQQQQKQQRPTPGDGSPMSCGYPDDRRISPQAASMSREFAGRIPASCSSDAAVAASGVSPSISNSEISVPFSMARGRSCSPQISGGRRVYDESEAAIDSSTSGGELESANYAETASAAPSSFDPVGSRLASSVSSDSIQSSSQCKRNSAVKLVLNDNAAPYPGQGFVPSPNFQRREEAESVVGAPSSTSAVMSPLQSSSSASSAFRPLHQSAASSQRGGLHDVETQSVPPPRTTVPRPTDLHEDLSQQSPVSQSARNYHQHTQPKQSQQQQVRQNGYAHEESSPPLPHQHSVTNQMSVLLDDDAPAASSAGATSDFPWEAMNDAGGKIAATELPRVEEGLSDFSGSESDDDRGEGRGSDRDDDDDDDDRDSLAAEGIAFDKSTAAAAAATEANQADSDVRSRAYDGKDVADSPCYKLPKLRSRSEDQEVSSKAHAYNLNSELSSFRRHCNNNNGVRQQQQQNVADDERVRQPGRYRGSKSTPSSGNGSGGGGGGVGSRDNVDRAIADIRSAIRHSSGLKNASAAAHVADNTDDGSGSGGEPVWLPRVENHTSSSRGKRGGLFDRDTTEDEDIETLAAAAAALGTTPRGEGTSVDGHNSVPGFNLTKNEHIQLQQQNNHASNQNQSPASLSSSRPNTFHHTTSGLDLYRQAQMPHDGNGGGSGVGGAGGEVAGAATSHAAPTETQQQQHPVTSTSSSAKRRFSEEESSSETETLDKGYCDDVETDRLVDNEYRRSTTVEIPEVEQSPLKREQQKARIKDMRVKVASPDNPTILIEGVLYGARYLGSTQLSTEGRPSKSLRMMQAQEAIARIKAPQGESQPSTDVELFVSTERILVLNTDLQEIMMDHSLRTISYIADIGDIVVLMARRNRSPSSPSSEDGSGGGNGAMAADLAAKRQQHKMVCHVFESEEAQDIARAIGQAFQVAYREFLKANGIEDHSFLKEVDYQEVLASQEIFNDELTLFSSDDKQREVVVVKGKGEMVGVVIVESGWGSMLPTVVVANLMPQGAAAKSGQLNIGDQLLAINGVSLVGLPLSTCQSHIKASKSQTVARFSVVPCAPVVEVRLKRPDVRCPLGFSVQNGIICSILRGGLAERGGVRVGHRIIEINGSSVVAVAHEKIVSVLANSVGEIQMKTMPTSIFRLLTGQETPQYI